MNKAFSKEVYGHSPTLGSARKTNSTYQYRENVQLTIMYTARRRRRRRHPHVYSGVILVSLGSLFFTSFM